MFLGNACEGNHPLQERDGAELDCRRLALYLTPIRALNPRFTLLTFAHPNRSVTAPTFKDTLRVLLTVTAM